MALVLKSWETHCAHLRLPRSLPNRLVGAGFRFDGASVFPIFNLQWGDDAYSKGLAGLIRDFVGRKNELPSEDLEEWYDEFTHLSEAGRHFFSTNNKQRSTLRMSGKRDHVTRKCEIYHLFQKL
jgi:arsenite methyltransferase